MLRSSNRIHTKAIYAAPFYNSRSVSPADGMEKSFLEIQKLLQLCGREDIEAVSYTHLDVYKRQKQPQGNNQLPVCHIGQPFTEQGRNAFRQIQRFRFGTAAVAGWIDDPGVQNDGVYHFHFRYRQIHRGAARLTAGAFAIAGREGRCISFAAVEDYLLIEERKTFYNGRAGVSGVDFKTGFEIERHVNAVEALIEGNLFQGNRRPDQFRSSCPDIDRVIDQRLITGA